MIERQYKCKDYNRLPGPDKALEKEFKFLVELDSSGIISAIITARRIMKNKKVEVMNGE